MSNFEFAAGLIVGGFVVFGLPVALAIWLRTPRDDARVEEECIGEGIELVHEWSFNQVTNHGTLVVKDRDTGAPFTSA